MSMSMKSRIKAGVGMALHGTTPEEIDYRERFKSCGKNVVVEPGVYIQHPETFEVGDDVTIMRGFVAIDRQEQVVLGNRVTLHPHVTLRGKGRLIVGDDVWFAPYNHIQTGGEPIEIGHRTHFAPGCVLYGGKGLYIGPHCGIAAHTVFATVAHDHRIADKKIVETFRSDPIRLEGDVWIGANVTIIGGVTIAERCVIGAGAVVTHSTDPGGVYLGVPARLSHYRPAPTEGEASSQ